MQHEPLMVQGGRDPAGHATVTSPYDLRPIATVDTGGREHVEHALESAYARFRDRRRWLSIPERVGILERTAKIMSERADELARLAASEGGKPLIDSRVEVARAIDGIALAIETLRAERGDVIPIASTVATGSRLAFTQKEPVGVVAAVSAFNHPLNLIVHQVAPAVATGCPVIVKPADDTPLSCLAFVRILREAGLPADLCQALVAEDLDAAEALVTDSRIGFFSFIGSARVGWMLRSKLAPGARAALEHGGAAPLFLAGDFDREAALAAVLKGGFYHAGQVCVSVQRVFAPADEASSFAESLAERACALRIGDPEAEDTEVGPLIRPAEVTRVHEWVREAVDGGAVQLSGGAPLSETCYPCTVLLNPPADVRVSTAEIFGPVVSVYAYEELDDAIEQANSLPVAFQAAVFTRDIDLAMHVYRNVDASAVMVNDHTAFRDDVMPFAGLRQSGLGVGGIPYTMEDMQVDKMAVIRSEALA